MPYFAYIRCPTNGTNGHRFSRPRHFKPFSQGKRSCMGYKLVENVCLAVTVALVRAFRMENAAGAAKIPPGILATPIEPILMKMANRTTN